MEIECPYCEKEFNLNHDDGFGYEEGVKHRQECPNCRKTFVFETSIVFYYDPIKAECLNDGVHDYQLNKTHPKEFSNMQCLTCGDMRELTNQERDIHKIGTKEDYLIRLKYKIE